MSDLIASPFGCGLPYSSLFSVPRKDDALNQRPPDYFWEKAIASPTPTPAVAAPSPVTQNFSSAADPNISQWLDDVRPVLSDSEDENQSNGKLPSMVRSKKGFARIRQIAFRAFVPKDSSKSGTVVATEIVSRKKFLSKNDPFNRRERGSGFTLFNSWHIKKRGVKTQVRKLAALVRNRVSSRSPEDQKPKTWEEYHRAYAAELIDINDPPLPPTEPDNENPTPFQNKCYMPPLADDEPMRQLVINRLGVFGRKAFDPSEEGAARSRERAELVEKLEQEGRLPTTLTQAWEPASSGTASAMNSDFTLGKKENASTCNLVPESLEQHPVFRRIVRQCRETFGASMSMLSILDADRQIFLAESGVGGLREAPRVVTVCAHTVLSGRKGFTILDTFSDWRFSASPLVNAHGVRFYAGVPLMSPNLDGSPESEASSCPLGTLCIIDDKPRQHFGIEDRKKLVYMAEYARREIGLWFKSKIQNKVIELEESHKSFIQKVQQHEDDTLGEEQPAMGQEAEILTSFGQNPELNNSLRSSPEHTQGTKARILGRFGSSRSLVSTPQTTPSPSESGWRSPHSVPPSEEPSLFDNNAAVRPKMQKVFDLATKLVGDTLDLPLVYLLAVKPHDDSAKTGRTLILSGYDLPLPFPSFNVALHLRALHAPEGGLLYQNPTPQQFQDAAILSNSKAGSNPYASAVLVRVGPEPKTTAGGFILAGFTGDSKRVFGAEDVTYMKQFGNELVRYTCKLKL